MKILLGVLVLAVALAAMVASRPSANDFHQWQAWNPWGKIDPGMTQSFEGAPAGVGAVYTWAGNREVGEGRMTIVEKGLADLTSISEARSRG